MAAYMNLVVHFPVDTVEVKRMSTIGGIIERYIRLVLINHAMHTALCTTQHGIDRQHRQARTPNRLKRLLGPRLSEATVGVDVPPRVVCLGISCSAAWREPFSLGSNTFVGYADEERLRPQRDMRSSKCEKLYFMKCGTHLPDDAQFCVKCGAVVNSVRLQ
jgi:ribosomal protein L40E